MQTDLALVGMSKVYTKKMVTSLKCNAVIVYELQSRWTSHRSLFSISFFMSSSLGWSLHQQLTLISTICGEYWTGLLNLSFPLSIIIDVLRASTVRDAQTVELEVRYRLIQSIQPLKEWVQPESVITLRGKTCNCHSALLDLCCDILEEKDLSGMKHVASIYQFVKRLVSERMRLAPWNSGQLD